MATAALNCRLGSTEVRPCMRMAPDHALTSTVRSIYRHDGSWVEKADADWRFCPGPFTTDPQRPYLTDPAGGAYLYVNGTQTKLGVVAPTTGPTCSASGGSGTAETRVYVYTMVSIHGEESAPSDPSDNLTCLPGCTVSLSAMTSPTNTVYAAYDKKRIYRSIVGASGASGYFFVDEIDASATTYSDTLTSAELGEELPSEGWAVPPSDLTGLTAIPGGFFAGFSGREVRMSEPWNPHAWPDKYSHVLQHDIVQLGVSGRILFAMTKGSVYFITLNDIDAAVPEMMPGDIPCVSAGSVVSTPLGVVFASKDGLYLVGPGYASPQLLTRGFYSEQDWQTMNPDSMFGAWHADQLFMFYSNAYGQRGGMIFDNIITEKPVLRFTDTAVDAATVVPDGRLLFVAAEGFVNAWEGDASFGMEATWASREFVAASPINFSAALVDAEYDISMDPIVLANELSRQLDVITDIHAGRIGGALGADMVGMVPFASDWLGVMAPFFDPDQYTGQTVEFKIWGDGVLRYTRTVSDDRPFALPAGYQARRWVVQTKGTANIRRIAVGESATEIYS